MKTTSICLLLISFIILSCNKAGNDHPYLKATVLETSDISCDLPILEFSEDAPGIRNITGQSDIDYTVIQLPANFNIQNKKLLVSIRTLHNEEEFPCNTLGIGYRHLKILGVKER